jgi:hypothetical protein
VAQLHEEQDTEEDSGLFVFELEPLEHEQEQEQEQDGRTERRAAAKAEEDEIGESDEDEELGNNDEEKKPLFKPFDRRAFEGLVSVSSTCCCLWAWVFLLNAAGGAAGLILAPRCEQSLKCLDSRMPMHSCDLPMPGVSTSLKKYTANACATSENRLDTKP